MRKEGKGLNYERVTGARVGKLIAPPAPWVSSANKKSALCYSLCTSIFSSPVRPSVRSSLLSSRPARTMHPGGLHGWAPGQPTAVIDLGEEFAPDPSNASSAALQFSAAYYSIDSSAERNGSKKRKVERACDFCRRRKARCDGPRMPDNVCSNCVTNARTCTYLYVLILLSSTCLLKPSMLPRAERARSRGVLQRRKCRRNSAPFSPELTSLCSYVVGLEDRVEKMEALLKRVSVS